MCFYQGLCKYPITNLTQSIRPNSTRTRSNSFTIRKNNGWNLTNSITFGSGVGPLNRPIWLSTPTKYYTKIHIFLSNPPPTQSYYTRPDSILPFIGSDSDSNFFNQTSSVRVSGDYKLNPNRPVNSPSLYYIIKQTPRKTHLLLSLFFNFFAYFIMSLYLSLFTSSTMGLFKRTSH